MQQFYGYYTRCNFHCTQSNPPPAYEFHIKTNCPTLQYIFRQKLFVMLS
jgi:hypothetical protein